MLRISKSQFNRAIERNSGLRLNRNQHTAVPAPSKSKHASRTILTVLVMVIGLATGWVLGRGLNGQMNDLPVDVPASDTTTLDGLTQLPPPEAQPPLKHAPRLAGAPASDDEEPPAEAESRPMESKPRAAPPRTAKVGRDDGPEAPTAKPVKETGWQTLEKMSKDVKKLKRALGNKNEN